MTNNSTKAGDERGGVAAVDALLREARDALKAGHNPLSHDYERDEKKCERCQFIAKLDAALRGGRTTDSDAASVSSKTAAPHLASEPQEPK